MSLPSVSTQPQPLPKAKPRFGNNNPAKPETTEAAIQAEPEDRLEVNDGAEKTGEAQQEAKKPNLFVAFGKRIEQFFKDVLKAFRKLFNLEKPKPEWAVQLKRLKHNLRTNLDEEKLAANFKRRTEELDAMSPEQREPFEEEYQVLKSEKDPKVLVNQALQAAAAGLAFQSHIIESAFAEDEEKSASQK